MGELQLKYIEIVFDKQTPQNIGIEINIFSKIDNHDGNLEYKFIVGKGGIWNTIQEFSNNNQCTWKPKMEGDYMVMVQAREKDGKKSLDYLAKEEYSIVTGDIVNTMNNDVDIEKGINDEKAKIDIRNAMNNVGDKVVFLEVKEPSNDEKFALEGNENISNNEKVFNDNVEEELNTIKEIIIEKEEVIVGEKCSIEVKTIYENNYLYRFYIKRYKEWDIVRDYDTSNILKYTATEAGEKEFLIQCKKMESTDNFEDFRVIKINVKDTTKIDITNFKCLSKSLIVGENIGFMVETNVNWDINDHEHQVLLYKFFKIYKDGKSICIQDYSTKNDVYYKESEPGDYRILCLVKSILSNKEYDDRAIIMYTINPYKEIKINKFLADLNSPQISETNIKFSSEVEGGHTLLYRYKVNGPISEDTGFISKDEFTWKPIESGEYEIILFVKDINYKGEHEDTKKINFIVESKENKPVKILDVVIDREKKIITGEPVNIMVSAEGGTKLQYAFIIKKDNRRLENIEYNKSNWINFIPKQVGEYAVEIMIKDKSSDKPYDKQTTIYLNAMEYLPGEIDYIILPYKEIHLVGEAIEFECIIQNTKNVLVKYETKINGNTIEQTEFLKNKSLKIIPKVAGKYTIDVYAKNLKCGGEYDSHKQINIFVSEALPVIETRIITNKTEGDVNEEFTFEAISRGGKDVCYEFYLMHNNDWKKVQSYSKKHYYSFIPFIPGEYKLLALAKSSYKRVNYEDYDEIIFKVATQVKN